MSQQITALQRDRSIENAKHILNTNGICMCCAWGDLKENFYDYCYWCKMEVLTKGDSNMQQRKIDMAKNYLETDMLTIKLDNIYKSMGMTSFYEHIQDVLKEGEIR